MRLAKWCALAALCVGTTFQFTSCIASIIESVFVNVATDAISDAITDGQQNEG